MSPTPATLEQPAPVARTTRAPRPWAAWLPIAAFSILWLDLIRLLSTQWEAREQYAYGWFVPLFAAALLWRRWLDRPGAGPRDHGTTGLQDHGTTGLRDHGTTGLRDSPQVSGFIPHPSSRFLLSAFCFLLCFLLLPLRVIYEINTDWPLISWVYTVIVVVLTLYAFHLADPHSEFRPQPSTLNPQLPFHPSSFILHPSKWLRHFAFPICFILVAVVWPYRIEKGLTQGLMRVVASITVELLGWIDIPALQRGNLIELATGTVGVDEACSGIRSFQSSLMAALLLGELYRFRLWPRAALVVLGLGLGFCFNIVRTLILSYQANAHGLGAIEKWHDPAGFTITVACFFCLWGLAVLMHKRWAAGLQDHGTTGLQDHGTTGLQDHGTTGLQDHGTTGLQDSPQVSGFTPPVSDGFQVSGLIPPVSGAPSSISPLPSSPILRAPHSALRTYLLAVGCWSLLSIAATEAWYRSRAINPADAIHWSLRLPESRKGLEKIDLPPKTAALLAQDQATMGRWVENDGSQWTAYWLRWNPKSLQSVIRARLHRPEICLNAAGLERISGPETILIQAGPLNLPFQKYEFKSGGSRLFVFFCLWEDGQDRQQGMRSLRQDDRLQWVIDRRRHLGQQTLELILTGYQSLEQAQAAVAARLPELIGVGGARADSSVVGGPQPRHASR